MGGVANLAPGAAGTNAQNNDVVIGTIAAGKSSPTIFSGDTYIINKLVIGSGFQNEIMGINGSLYIRGSGASEFNAGQIQLGKDGLLDVQTNLTWDSKDGFKGGTVQVDGEGSMTVESTAQNFKSNLFIGGTLGTGTVTLSDMQANLTLTNASIGVYAGGYLNFAQNKNSDTMGGIASGSSGSITIAGGTVERTGVDNAALTIGVPIAVGLDINGMQGRLILDTGTSTDVEATASTGYSVISVGGLIEQQVRSYLKASAGVELTSSYSIYRVDGTDAAKSLVMLDGSLTVNDGLLVIGYGETTKFTEFSIEDNFMITGGTLLMSIKGGMSVEDCDLINVSRKLTVGSGATLEVEDQNGVAPDPEVKYLLILPGTDTVTRFGAITNENAPVIDWADSIEGGYKIFVKAATALNLNSDINPSILGQAVTFTASLMGTLPGTTPTGTVTFYDGSASLGSRLAGPGNDGFPGEPDDLDPGGGGRQYHCRLQRRLDLPGQHLVGTDRNRAAADGVHLPQRQYPHVQPGRRRYLHRHRHGLRRPQSDRDGDLLRWRQPAGHRNAQSRNRRQSGQLDDHRSCRWRPQYHRGLQWRRHFREQHFLHGNGDRAASQRLDGPDIAHDEQCHGNGRLRRDLHRRGHRHRRYPDGNRDLAPTEPRSLLRWRWASP